MPKKTENKTKKSATELPLLMRNKALAKKIMWAGTAVFLTIIVVFWGWSLAINIANINLAKTPEKKLFSSTATDWNQVFRATKDAADQKINLEKIKQQIKQILEETENKPQP